MNKQLAVADPNSINKEIGQCMTVAQVLGQVALIQQIMQTAMQEGTHYGKIPGCGDKPTLLKPGAEKLCLTFRMAPTYDVKERLLDGGHREYSITCTLTSILTDKVLGQGVGFGSTMESKYRFTKGEGEATDKPVPRTYWDAKNGGNFAQAQELLGGKGYSVKKVEGKGWMIAKGGEKQENTNPADQTNTVMKMTKKRALVDAVLTATAASDLMTQDLEEIVENQRAYAPATGSKVLVEDHDNMVPAGPNSQHSAPAWKEVDASVASFPNGDFREVTVHVGLNRGLRLHELSPQQIHKLDTKWRDDTHQQGVLSEDDKMLLAALDAYRNWCSDHHGNGSKPKGGQAVNEHRG